MKRRALFLVWRQLRMKQQKDIMTNKIIYTRRIAMKLIEAGNIPAGTMPNPSKPEFLTWIFAETPKFSNDLAKILGERPARARDEEDAE